VGSNATAYVPVLGPRCGWSASRRPGPASKPAVTREFTGARPARFRVVFVALQDEDGQDIRIRIDSGRRNIRVWVRACVAGDNGGRSTGRHRQRGDGCVCLLCPDGKAIIPAIESAHAVAGGDQTGREMGRGAIIVGKCRSRRQRRRDGREVAADSTTNRQNGRHDRRAEREGSWPTHFQC